MAGITYKGFAFPIRKTARGYFARVDDIELVKGDLIQLILTEPGERVMAPEFGTGLRGLIFNQSDELTSQEASERIKRAILRFEPRIVVRSLEVTFDADASQDVNAEHVMRIKLEFAMKDNLSELTTLELPIGQR